MKAAVVIPTYNGRELLWRYLPRLVSTVNGTPVAVVDDAGSDGSVEMLRDTFPSVRVIARHKNGGFSAAVNDGIRSTDSDLVVLLNNDVEVTLGFLDPILPLFDDDDVFAVSPRILLPTRGNLDEGAKTAAWRHGMLYTDQVQGGEDVTPVIYVTGCAAVYRRSMLEALCCFDEAYSPFYWEDVDLCYRAWKRGWKSLYQPASVVYHQHSASTSKLDPRYTGRIKARNSLFFIWRNFESSRIQSVHRRWLPLVLLRRALAGDRAFAAGWREAFASRREAEDARKRDSQFRTTPDAEILRTVGVAMP